LRELVAVLDDGTLTREGLVGAFCALLELVKIGVVNIEQREQGAEIGVAWASDGDGARMAESASADALAPPLTDAAARSTSRIIAPRSSSRRSMVSRIAVALLMPAGSMGKSGAGAGGEGVVGVCRDLLRKVSIPAHLRHRRG
jgi:hypothetical protein